MRDAVVDEYSNRIEACRDLLIERCDETKLLANAHRIYAIGGVPLPSWVGKDELARWVVFGAKRLFVHSMEQRLWFFGDFDDEKRRVEERALLGYESWKSLFKSWCDEP